MLVEIPYGRSLLSIGMPEDTIVYRSGYHEPEKSACKIVTTALENPIGAPTLKEALGKRREGKVAVVVSDITRPVPYRDFLDVLTGVIESAGVRREDILIIVATGMHRPSTEEERKYMFGGAAEKYAVEDHDAQGRLKKLDGLSLSGNPVFLNESFVNAGFRIVTGLVEPHFMAGFSGGRKAVCPGLSSIETIQTFHGFEFLGSPKATNGVLEGNPCHEEALSVARLAGVDYSLNVVLDAGKRLVAAYAGDLKAAHLAACGFVKTHACPDVIEEADAVITGCGGYPLDATFYQCVKAMVGAVPAVKQGGKIVAAGCCSSGMGSEEYREIMFANSGDCRRFIDRIRGSCRVEKDQWEFQMQIRAIEWTGKDGLVFLSSGLDAGERLHTAAFALHAEADSAAASSLQGIVNRLALDGKKMAVIPEGPYCTPLPRST